MEDDFCSQLVFPWLLGFGLAEGCDSSASQIPGCVTPCSSSPARAQLPAPPKCFPGENDPEIGYYLAMKPQPCRWSPPRKPSLALDGILGGAPDIWAGLGSLSQDNCAPHGRGNVLSPSPLIIPGIVVISWQFFSLGDGTRLGWVSAVISSPLCSRSPGDERDLLPGFADLWERDKIGDKSTFSCSGLLEAFSRGENCWIAAFANSFCFSGTVTPKNNQGDQCRSPMGGAELQKLGCCVSQEHFLQDLSCPGPCSSCLCLGVWVGACKGIHWNCSWICLPGGSEGLWDQTGIQKSSFQSPLASWGKSLKLPKPALPPCLIFPSPFPCSACLDGEISEFRAVCGFP